MSRKPVVPTICHLDDGATLIEFIWKNARIGVSIEKDLKESCWYYVIKHGDSMSGYIFKDEEEE